MNVVAKKILLVCKSGIYSRICFLFKGFNGGGNKG